MRGEVGLRSNPGEGRGTASIRSRPLGRAQPRYPARLPPRPIHCPAPHPILLPAQSGEKGPAAAGAEAATY
ncbi:hypothetical protein DY468_16515 [Rhodopseudomonas sp. BR0M22]|nr:hypothetical protein [Rhodopseudomonas sp. BR0M22]